MTQDKNVVYKITVNADDATATVRRLDGTIVATQVNVQSLRKEFGNFSAQVGRSTQVAADKFNTFNQSVKSAKIEQQGLSRATGGATTSVLELGRVVSDAPYGIRGMANNISQLASNMLFTAQQTDAVTGKVIGFTGVLKQMGKVFLGPLGLLFVIQAAISALDYFWGSAKKAEEGIEGIGSAIGSAAADLRILKTALDEGTISTEEANKAIDAANKKYSDLNLEIDNNKKLTEESVTAIDEKIDALERLAKATALQKKVEEAYGKIIDAQLDAEEKLKEAGTLNLEEVLNQQEEFVKKYKEVTEREGKSFVELTKEQQEEIYSGFDLSFDQAKIGGEFKKTKDTFKEEVDGLIDILNKENLFDELFNSKEPKDKRDKVESVGAILTAEELEEARIKQAEQIDALFQDKFKLDEQNAQYFIDLNKSVGEQIAADSDIAEAQRAESAKKWAEYREKIAWIEAQQKAEALDYAASALDSFSVVAGEQTAVGKALAIAAATIDTYAGANLALKDPTIPNTFARIAAVTAVVATGLANVKKIIEVKTPGGGGGGSAPSVKESRTFDFNLVGSTGQNQLAQTIGGQVNQPIKAYVVGSEITNQQAFDNQIQGQVTIG
jgi:hypothetical protein